MLEDSPSAFGHKLPRLGLIAARGCSPWAMARSTRSRGAIKGLLDEHQRKELAHNIKRGQRGSATEDRSPAGLAYGYRKANRIDEHGRFVRGLREIDPDQAEVVRRIFRNLRLASRLGRSPSA